MKRTISVDAALRDRQLLGAALGDLASWRTWSIALKGAFGLPLNDAERTIFDAIAGGRTPPARPVRELWAVAGRRSGKTRMAAAISVHIGAIEQHTLAPGEVGYVLLLAASRSRRGLLSTMSAAFSTRAQSCGSKSWASRRKKSGLGITS